MNKPLSNLALRNGTWLAVCDGTTGLLLENVGDHAYPKLETRFATRHPNPSSHEQGTSQPGRSISSGGQHSSMEETDYHAQQAQAFLTQFAGQIDAHVKSAGVKMLMLVAPARALGLIRKMLSDPVRHVLVGEVDRDYVKLPLTEIEKHLRALV